MFSNTAYEALYQYLGLKLHSGFIDIITSQKVFLSVILLIFGIMFFSTSTQFFSRYLPGALVHRRFVPLSRYVRIVFCLFLGISLLRVGSNTSVKKYSGESWDRNEYVIRNGGGAQSEYRVSFVFDLLSRSAEETSALLSRVIDRLFAKTNSQLEAPNFFYKAIMMAGASTITDPSLRESISFYTDECLDKVLAVVGNEEGRERLDGFFSDRAGSEEINQRLAQISLKSPGTAPYTCLDAKNEVQQRLISYTQANSGDFRTMMKGYLGNAMDESSWLNLQASMTLVDLYLTEKESFAGIQKGSQPPTGSARIFQYLNRLFSWDGLVSLLGNEEHGASLAAERSQEFSENLSRAPHVAGFIKMALIALFPWLVFPMVAGYWRILLLWFFAYLSVLLWTPIWALFYHIVTGIALSTEAMEALGRLSDGVSLYSAQLVTSRMNYMFAVYSWLQLLIGAAFTGTILWIIRPVLNDTQGESAPEFLGEAQSMTTAGSRAGSNLIGGLK